MTSTDFQITVIQSVPGDFNTDGHVDAADYVLWRKTQGNATNYNAWRINFGESSAPPTPPGDFNTDGHVDAADYVLWRKTGGGAANYNIWRTNFGTSTSGGGT